MQAWHANVHYICSESGFKRVVRGRGNAALKAKLPPITRKKATVFAVVAKNTPLDLAISNLKIRLISVASILLLLAFAAGGALTLVVQATANGSITTAGSIGLVGAVLACAIIVGILVARSSWQNVNVSVTVYQYLQAHAAEEKLVSVPEINKKDTFDGVAVLNKLFLQGRLEQQRLQLIANNLPALIAYVDTECEIIFANRHYEKAYGIPHDKLTTLTIRGVLGDDVYAQSEQFIRTALMGKATQFERLVTHIGELRWERVSYTPEFATNGAVVGFITLAEDITDLKRAQHTFAKSEMRLRMITDNMPALIAYIDKDLHYRFCNGYYETILNLAPEKILGQTLQQIAGAAMYDEIAEQVDQVLAGQRVSFETQSKTEYGRYFLHDFLPDIDLDGVVSGFYSMVVDITARKEAELHQRASENLLRSVTDHLPVLVSYIDANERFQFNNRPYEKWFQRPLEAITGQRLVDLLPAAEYTRHQTYYARARGGEIAEFEFESLQGDSLNIYHAIYLPQFDQQQQLTGVCSMINDVTATKRIENQLRILARFDSLTGLPNRNQFDDKLCDAMARSRRTGQAMALLFLDIDHFKSINDTLAHQAGDGVLREFAIRLNKSVRQTDTVARLAGDEFVIIVEGLQSAEHSARIATKIIDAMRAHFDILGTHRYLSTSIGIVIGQGDETDAAELLHRADEALYEAKAAGRNTFRIAS